MVSIADALDGPTSLINYHGISYGGILCVAFHIATSLILLQTKELYLESTLLIVRHAVTRYFSLS